MLSPKPRYVHSLPTYETLWIAPKDIASLESHRPPSIAETLRLRRISATTARPPVLLVHGLSAQSNTFEINEDPAGGLAAFLDAHYTVWLVDYRGSSCPEVLERLRVLSPSTRAGTFGFGATSLHDIARAIRVVEGNHWRTFRHSVTFQNGNIIFCFKIFQNLHRQSRPTR